MPADPAHPWKDLTEHNFPLTQHIKNLDGEMLHIEQGSIQFQNSSIQV